MGILLSLSCLPSERRNCTDAMFHLQWLFHFPDKAKDKDKVCEKAKISDMS